MVVDVVEPRRDVACDVVAACPTQHGALLVDAPRGQVLVQAAVGHVLIHQQQLPFLVAPT